MQRSGLDLVLRVSNTNARTLRDDYLVGNGDRRRDSPLEVIPKCADRGQTI